MGLGLVIVLAAGGLAYGIFSRITYRMDPAAAIAIPRGRFRPVIKPANVEGLSFYRGNTKLGEYHPRSPEEAIEMPEGEYELELRGAALKAPVKVHVTVLASQTTPTVTIDLAGRLSD